MSWEVLACLLLSLSWTAHSTPDPGRGSFRCHPCARSNCYLSNTDKTVNIPNLGTFTCGELQIAADDKTLFPDECADLQTVTLGPSDPCDCKFTDGTDCAAAGFTNTQACNLCGADQRIGDPHKIIDTPGELYSTECIAAFDANANGAFVAICAEARDAIRANCQCVDLGVAVTQCIPVEQDTCDPGNANDVCCDGSCRYRHSHGRHICSTKPADIAPPSNPPAPAPIFQTAPGPGTAGQAGSECTANSSCIHGDCANIDASTGKGVCPGSKGGVAMCMESSAGADSGGTGSQGCRKLGLRSQATNLQESNGRKRGVTKPRAI